MSVDACAARVERGDPDRFTAVMAAPVAVRARLFVLYAFNLEVARAPWVTREPLIAEMRLQWWRDVITEDRPRAHEVAGPLHALIREAGLSVSVLDALIAARRHDIHPEPFGDLAAFDSYLHRTGGGLMWLAARACGAGHAVEPVAHDLGYAVGMAGYLRAVPALQARGRVALLDDAPGAVAAQAREGLIRLARARRARSGAAAVPAAAALAAWQTAALLRQAVKDPGRVAAGTLGLSEFDRRRLLVWQSVTGRF